MAHCYWHDELEGSVAGDVVTLTGEEAHHAAVVSRMRRGERVSVQSCPRSLDRYRATARTAAMFAG